MIFYNLKKFIENNKNIEPLTTIKGESVQYFILGNYVIGIIIRRSTEYFFCVSIGYFKNSDLYWGFDLIEGPVYLKKEWYGYHLRGI